MNDRIPCSHEGCKRTAKRRPEDGPKSEIICAKCWKLLPRQMKDRYRQTRQRYRKICRALEKRPDDARLHRLSWAAHRLIMRNWADLCRYLNATEGPPAGLEDFMKEAGLC